MAELADAQDLGDATSVKKLLYNYNLIFVPIESDNLCSFLLFNRREL